MAIVLSELGEMSVAATDGLWLSAEDAARATGWTLRVGFETHEARARRRTSSMMEAA
jgi:hypothetical protein